MNLFNLDATLNLGQEDNSNFNIVENEIKVNSLSYRDVLDLVDNVISLDISVKSTGWVKKINGVVTEGVRCLESKDDLGRRQEFKSFIRELFGNDEFNFVVIEDVIGSCNFKTAKSLMQLNPIVDDMKYDGVIKVNKIIREGNKSWKRNLKELAGYTSKIRCENDKDLIVNCMHMLGFEYNLKSTKEPNGVEQDIFDAYGMLCGVIYDLHIKKGKSAKAKLKTDILKGYTIKEFNSTDEAIAFVEKKGLEPIVESFVDKSRDLRYNFKKLVELRGDSGVFVLSIETGKLGVVAIEKELRIDRDISHLVVMRRK